MSPGTDRSTGPYRANRRRRQHIYLTGRGRRSLIPPGLPAFTGPRGSFGAERQSPRGFSPYPTTPGVPDGRTAASPTCRGRRTGGKRRGSGRVWSSDRPCPLRDHVPLRAAGPSTYGGQDFLEGGKLPDQALECQDFHRCRRDSPPTILMGLSKNRSVRRLQRPWRLHRVGGLIGRPGRWSPGFRPGSYRTTGSPSASSWGHQGVDLEGTKRPGPCGHYQPPGSAPGEAAPAALSGFHTVTGRESS